jgi:hypothetical protein
MLNADLNQILFIMCCLVLSLETVIILVLYLLWWQECVLRPQGMTRWHVFKKMFVLWGK